MLCIHLKPNVDNVAAVSRASASSQVDRPVGCATKVQALVLFDAAILGPVVHVANPFDVVVYDDIRVGAAVVQLSKWLVAFSDVVDLAIGKVPASICAFAFLGRRVTSSPQILARGSRAIWVGHLEATAVAGYAYYDLMRRSTGPGDHSERVQGLCDVDVRSQAVPVVTTRTANDIEISHTKPRALSMKGVLEASYLVHLLPTSHWP